MFQIAFLTGFFSLITFFLGVMGIFSKNLLIFLSIIFALLTVFIYRNTLRSFVNELKIPSTFLAKVILFLLFCLAVVNLIGALGPELSFDALWYHLTLPKIYLLNQRVQYIPNGLFYYSAMPQLGEMLYALALAFGSEIFAKLLHFSFGLLSCLALFKLSRKFFSQTLSLLVVLVFYSNLVVGFESIAAYVDLIRTFFELTAFIAFYNWYTTTSKKWLIISAFLLGFAIDTKYLAFGSLLIFSVLIVLKNKVSLLQKLTNVLVYFCISILVILPWIIYSYLYTRSPFYPFFTHTYPIKIPISIWNPFNFLKDIWDLFLYSADPISPVYIGFLPLIILAFKQTNIKMRIFFIYSFLALLAWYFTPRTGGGRFILPYLPIFSILVVVVIQTTKDVLLKKALIFFILMVACTSLVYRGVANCKFIPVIIGKETRAQFLTKHLNFNFGDFYDTDGYFATNIKNNQKVLLIGFHNEYYVNFPFIDYSWYKKSDAINYVAVQNGVLPNMFSGFRVIYQNKLTHVKLYAKD